MYGFFLPNVTVGYEGMRKCHFFPCTTKKCQASKGIRGVRQYQDTKDHSATSNLWSHAIKCFGKDAVDVAFNKPQPKDQDTSIFAAFAQQGQRPAKVSHCTHTKAETQ